MVVVVRRTHTRPSARTTEDGIRWLRDWDNRHFLAVLASPPFRPWRHTSEREMQAAVDGLLKLRGLYDAGICRG
jgi:hypothetical protein